MRNKNQHLFIIAFNCKSIKTKLGKLKLYLYKKKHTLYICDKLGGIGILVRNDIAIMKSEI